MAQSCTLKSKKCSDCDCNVRQSLMIMAGFLAFGLVGMYVVGYWMT